MSNAPPQFAAHTAHAETIIDAVRAAADPSAAVRSAMPDNLGPPEHLRIIACGKASLAMAAAACESLPAPPAQLLITANPDLLQRQPPLPASAECFPVDHPLPTDRNTTAASRIEQAVTEAGHNDTVLVLISGGGSAHLTAPADGLELQDLRRITDALLRAGATIEQINTVRKHCERLKGGRLAALTAPARLITLIISDVTSDRLDAIASGPTVPDPTTYQHALDVLERHSLTDEVPAITAHLQRGQRGDIAETPKPGDPAFDQTETHLIASNRLAVDAAARAAATLGFNPINQRTGIEGEAAQVGRDLARTAGAHQTDAPCACIWGGETTVTVGEATGTGGRNQELALAAALELETADNTTTCIATFATDGIDGPTDAAGAIVSHQTPARIRHHGLDPAHALANHDAHTALDAAGDLIRTGPTGTNINDVAIALIYPAPHPA